MAISIRSVVNHLAGRNSNVRAYKRADGTVFLTVRNEADGDMAEMVIEGPIGDDPYQESTSSKTFRKALNEIPKQREVRVRIHSPGGSVGDALAIHNLIKERGNVDTHVDGYALSSASLIVQAGRHRTMPNSALMMIHNPHSGTYGDEEEHRKAMEMLKKHGQTMAEMYAEASGKTVEECKALMEKETWLTGGDAAEHKFVDEVLHDADDEAEARAKVSTLDFTQFQKVPQAVLAMFGQTISAAPSSDGPPATPPAPTPVDPTMNATPTPTAAATPPANPNPTPAPASPAAAPPDSVTIPRADLDAIRASLDRERTARIEARLDRLIDERRLTNEERADALARAKADETYLEVISRRPSQDLPGLPIGPGTRIESDGNFLDRIRNLRAQGNPHPIGGMEVAHAAARYAERRDNWAAMYTQAMAMDARAGLDAANPGRGTGRPTLSNPNVQYCKVVPTVDGGHILPVAASTYSTTLIVDQLADAAITSLVNVFAPLRAFARDFAPSPFMPLSTLQVRLVTQGGGTTSKIGKSTGTDNPTDVDYEATGDHVVNPVSITMFERNKSFFVNPQELMSGLRIEFLATRAMLEWGTDITTTVLALLNDQTMSAGPSGGSITAHYGNWTWNSASSSINDMAVLRSQLGKSDVKNAVLDPVLFSKLITIPVANQMQVGMPLANANTMRNIMGWDEIVETTAWATGQGAGGSTASFPQPIIGFACHPQAIAVGARLPILPPSGIPGNTLTMATVTIPGLDMTVALFQWFSLRYRTLWHAFDIVFGAIEGDTTAGCVVKSLGI